MNPLDSLPFDVNTLIPYNAFNWDVIHGIDKIHNDTMQVYQRIATNAMESLVPIEEKIDRISNSVSQQLENRIAPIQQTIAAIDQSVINHIDPKVQNLVTSYGLPGQPMYWYLVCRCMPYQHWTFFLEQWPVKPAITVPYYGPFDNGAILCKAAKELLDGPFKELSCEQNNQGFRTALLSKYNEFSQSLSGTIADTDVSSCGIPIRLLSDPIPQCNQPPERRDDRGSTTPTDTGTTPGTGTIGPLATYDVTYGPVITDSCTRIQNQSADNTTPWYYVLGTANRGKGNCPYQVVFVPYGIGIATVKNTQYNLYPMWGPLESWQAAYDWAWTNYIPLCCTDVVPPVILPPIITPPPIGTICPPEKICPPCLPPLIAPPSVIKDGTISNPCCPDEISALVRIGDILNHNTAPGDDCQDFGDDAFAISDCAPTHYLDFVRREQIHESKDYDFQKLGDVTDMMETWLDEKQTKEQAGSEEYMS